MEGDGVLAHVYGAYKALTEGARKGAPRKVSDWLAKVGQQPIVQLGVARKPIQQGVQWVLNALSLGAFNSVVERLGYDHVFHNYLLVQLADGTTWKVEKNHVVDVVRASATDLKPPEGRVGSLPVQSGTTFAQLLARAERLRPTAFWTYDGSTHNCQDFTTRVALATQQAVRDPYARELITPQDGRALIGALGRLSFLPRKITDLAAVADRIIQGDGVHAEKKLSAETKMTYIPTTLTLSAAQQKRLFSGQSVRIKMDALGGGNCTVALTATQVARIKKSIAAGKGLQLQLSASQLEAQGEKAGAGLKDWIAGVAPVAKGLAQSLLEQHGGKAIDAGAKAAASALSKSDVPAALMPFLEIGLSLGAKHGKDQLDAILQGIKKGSGLYAPGVRP